MAAFSKQDTDMSGGIHYQDLDSVYVRLGYVAASPETIYECCKRLGILSKRELIFEDLFNLLDDFRSHESFLAEELEEIRETFGKHSNSHKKIGGIDLCSAIRWLGYPQTLEKMQTVLEEFDLDKSFELDFLEFRKLIRRYHEEVHLQLRKAFESGDMDNDNGLNAEELRQALLSLGHTPSPDECQVVLSKYVEKGKYNLDWRRAVQALKSFFFTTRTYVRDHHGFTKKEVNDKRLRYSKYDSEGQDKVTGEKLRNLLGEVYPDATTNKDTYQKVKDVIMAVSGSHHGGLNFDDFLEMMRTVENEEQVRKHTRENDAIKSTGYTRAEVHEFRQIFDMFDADESGQMDFEELAGMFQHLLPAGDKAMGSLKRFLSSVDQDSDRQADFPEFMMLMKKLQSENWNDINTLIPEKEEPDRPTSEEARNSAAKESALDRTLGDTWNAPDMGCDEEDDEEEQDPFAFR
jgi:Ca2+-binding EF-hand superfamily protein